MIIPLQGKYTSNSFKYGRILVSKCTNSSIYGNTTCATSAEVDAFIASQQIVTANLYFVNPVINAGSKTYIDYYLEDANYFTFNTLNGVSANMYFSEYSITTDHSIFPWKDTSVDSGVIGTGIALGQSYAVSSNNQYAKIYIRKASGRYDITRSFQKVDQTLSFIGGLFGTVVLIFLFVSIYDKYCY